MDAPALTPAIVRLYGRCREIDCEIEEALDDQEPVDHLLARCRRAHDDPLNVKYERAKAKIKADILARHKEYQWTRRELGRLLGLGAGDIHPLDVDYDQEWEVGDPRWERASELRFDLDRAHIAALCWWDSPHRVQLLA